ncbi:MAG: cell division protein FtsI [Proteobacteria bacterium]|nr:cell division protein FtsI [Pseudomonadota bacterium]
MKLAILLCALPLSACVVISVPIDETLNAVVSGVSEVMASSTADAPLCSPRFAFRSICIEYNPLVSVADFVPTVQSRLKQLQVDSMLYAPSAMPLACEVTLHYTATRGWSSHFTSSELQHYLGEAELTLRQSGRVISLARYQTSRLGYEKWTSTDVKMAPVVDELMCVKKG